jgi:hypothetical protein
MRNDFRTIGEQVLSGVFMTLWLLSLPFVWTYSLLKWFIVSVFKETGNRLVKIVGGALAILIVGLVTQYFIG